MGSCVWGAQLQESVAGIPCSPREGAAPHMPPVAAGRVCARRCTPRRLGGRPSSRPRLRLLAEPCPLPLLPLFCGHVSPLGRGDPRGAAGGRGGQHCPSQPLHISLPSAPRTLPGPATEGGGGGGGSRRGLRRSGSACLDPGMFWPHPQTGEVFPSPLTLFKFKATAAAQSPQPHPAGGPAELRPGVPLEQLRSHPGVGFPTPGALSCVPPRADGGAP